MPESPRILLVTPHAVVVEPPSDQITVRLLESDEPTDVLHDLQEFTHIAVGPARGTVHSLDLIQAASRGQHAGATFFPLPGFEWISELNGSGFIQNAIACMANGALVLAPIESLQYRIAQNSLTTGGCTLSGLMFDTVPLDHSARIASTDRPVAETGRPFELPQLVPERDAAHDQAVSSLIDSDTLSELFGPHRTALMSGMYQIEDMLDASHTLAQSVEGHPDGDYWHAIMHRREPDYGNSKYWFRHVGRHPVFAQLAPRAAEILNDAPADLRADWAPKLKADSTWDPFAFVDMCAAGADDEDGDLGMTARRIQWLEMLLLLKHCAQQAG